MANSKQCNPQRAQTERVEVSPVENPVVGLELELELESWLPSISLRGNAISEANIEVLTYGILLWVR